MPLGQGSRLASLVPGDSVAVAALPLTSGWGTSQPQAPVPASLEAQTRAVRRIALAVKQKYLSSFVRIKFELWEILKNTFCA